MIENNLIQINSKVKLKNSSQIMTVKDLFVGKDISYNNVNLAICEYSTQYVNFTDVIPLEHLEVIDA